MLLLSCAGKQVAPEPVPAAPEPAPDVQVHMAEHLVRATSTRDSVVQGRFDEAREGFRWIAEHQADDSLLAGSHGWRDELREVAA
ncbi:MAG: hypothetical protein GY913_18995 [Proteobacteria bacterium]|nr:hypothetical protein [Pseudomonadota bacterium]MCP4918997.1 hypothetical protein [Pseudomonadota bacterium]